MKNYFYDRLVNELNTLQTAGTYKHLKYVTSKVDNGCVDVEGYGNLIVLCSNNYLGLDSKPEIIEAGVKAMQKYGGGTSSVRFICGTFDIHKELEQKVSDFLGMESTLTYTSCWNANTAAIPALLSDGDAVISDELNHASIIDGCRMVSKGVKKAVYKHSDMQSLEEKLKELSDCKSVLIVTDGVFSMEGDIAKLPQIIELAKKYGALVMIDESHSTGVMGKTGRGVMEHYNITEGVDIVSGTFGKTLGGAGGGFISGKKEIREMLIQKSRPSLFSNSLPPVLCAIAMASIQYIEDNPKIVESLHKKTDYARKAIKAAGLSPLDGESAIIPIIVGETSKAIKAANQTIERGIYTTGFGFPVVPEGHARVRLQISDALEYSQLDKAIEVIADVIKKL